MSGNLYQKTYNAIKKNNPTFNNNDETLAFCFKGAGKYMKKISISLQEGRFEDRANLSNTLIMILSSISSVADQLPLEDRQKVKPIRDFCEIILQLVTRVNLTNSETLAENITKSLFDMGHYWENSAKENNADHISSIVNAATSMDMLPSQNIPTKKSPYPSQMKNQSISISG